MTARSPFRVRCGRCQHVWPAFHPPIPMEEAARILKALRCPECDASAKQIFIATGA